MPKQHWHDCLWRNNKYSALILINIFTTLERECVKGSTGVGSPFTILLSPLCPSVTLHQPFSCWWYIILPSSQPCPPLCLLPTHQPPADPHDLTTTLTKPVDTSSLPGFVMGTCVVWLVAMKMKQRAKEKGRKVLLSACRYSMTHTHAHTSL